MLVNFKISPLPPFERSRSSPLLTPACHPLSFPFFPGETISAEFIQVLRFSKQREGGSEIFKPQEEQANKRNLAGPCAQVSRKLLGFAERFLPPPSPPQRSSESVRNSTANGWRLARWPRVLARGRGVRDGLKKKKILPSELQGEKSATRSPFPLPGRRCGQPKGQAAGPGRARESTASSSPFWDWGAGE